MADDEPRNSSCTASSATSSGGSSSPPSPRLAAAAAPPLPPPPPAPFAASFLSPSTATPAAFPLPPQQLFQQYQQQFQQQQQQQQQRLLSLQLSSAAGSSPPATGSPAPPLKNLLLLPAGHHGEHPALAATPAADRHSRDDCWSEGATITLIHAWGDRYLDLNRGNLKQKHWQDVADCVNRRSEGSKAHKTDIQCKNRLDTLKKKYKLEKSKIVTGGGPSKWTFFDSLDELIGPSKKPKKALPAVKPRPSLPLMPAPLQVLTASKRPLDEADQLLQLPPPSLPPLGNPCASPVANHVVAINHHAGSAADTSSKLKESPDMTDSCPNADAAEGKCSKRKRRHDDPMKELAQAVMKFGEVYERIEISKQKKMVELEKQRMIFTKDLELQRLQFFMQTQVELAKLKHISKHGNADNGL